MHRHHTSCACRHACVQNTNAGSVIVPPPFLILKKFQPVAYNNTGKVPGAARVAPWERSSSRQSA
eukprot:7982138-Alexandrium_andersonii.AAC.1